ncbi:hypothetical protein DBR42_01150 [Pelomonas sp. HMWF004]|nr:hypothetical protein DBR42_01150 [Pelomonas sp. HMWF004]
MASDHSPPRGGLGFWISLVLLLLSVDYFPNLPDASLDSSWMNGVALALAQGAVPGRDLLFTYGPLAALMTGYAGPGFLLGVAVALALASHLALLLQAVLGARLLVGVLLVFLICPNNEALFFIYLAVLPLAIATAATDMQARGPGTASAAVVPLWPAAVIVPTLILSKLSFLPISVVLLVLTLALWLAQRRVKVAAGALVLSLVSLVAWWLITGQRLADLPHFLLNGEIIKGYSTAMEYDIGAAVGGISLQLIETLLLYAASAALLALIVPRVAGVRLRLYLLLALAAVLAVVIKAAVARHGGVHSIFPWLLLPLLALAVPGALRLPKPARAILAVGLVAVVALSPIYNRDGRGLTPIGEAARAHAESRGLAWQQQKRRPAFWGEYLLSAPGEFLSSLSNPMPGTKERLDNAWQLARAVASGGESFRVEREAVEQAIRAACGLRPVPGSADIYPTAINCLLVNGQDWSPRPVLQSYSAYTNLLLALNRDHLEGPRAPGHLFFDIQPIDDRLPMMEDGASWSCIAAHYRPAGALQGRFLPLTRVDGGTCAPPPVTEQRTVALGEPVTLSCDRPLTQASFEFRPSMAGRLVGTVYKTRRLMIDVTTCDGATASYRIVPGMVGLPFPISPLIDTATEFRRVYFDAAGEPGRRVARFVVRDGVSESPVRGWTGEYKLRLHANEPVVGGGTAPAASAAVAVLDSSTSSAISPQAASQHR